MAAILVVDDDRAALEIRKLLLERYGHTVTIAADTLSAREAFERGSFDIVITDLRVPDAEDGLSLIREFRAVRIIVLCGNIADIEGREEAAMAGAILTKPVRSEILLNEVNK